MRLLIPVTTLFLLLSPVLQPAALAEEPGRAASPEEAVAGIQAAWNWLESLSDFQPYLPAKMPSQKQWAHLSLWTARKCKLRGDRNVARGIVADAQARAGDTEGLLATFREFDIEPKDQAGYLAQLAFATGKEPRRAEELRNAPDFLRSYCLKLADEQEEAGQIEKSIDTLSRLPADKDSYLLIVPYAKAGRLEKAVEILALLREKKWNPYDLERNLAKYLAREGKKGEARRFLASSLADLRELKTPGDRLREAYFFAPLLRQIGDKTEQRAFLTDCERWDEEERGHEDMASKSSGAFSLARIAKDTGDDEFARKSIVRAVKLLREATPKDFVRRAHYASLQASLGMVAESKQTAKEALANARDISEEEKRDSNLSSVVEHFAAYRNESLLDEIDATLGEMRTLTWRGLAMCGVLEFEIRHEQWQRAKRHLEEGREYLRRKDLDRAEAFVHQFELDLLTARLLATQGETDASRKLLQELLRRGYAPEAGDFTQKVFYEQRELGFLEDAWWTATWIPELDDRYSALGSVMDAAMERARKRPGSEAAPQP